MSQLQPGESLGPYQMVSQVGKGGMATVYKAFHPATNRYVALKVLPENLADNPEFISRFRQEVRTIANLQHPQILPVFDYGEDGGRMYMVMRYLDTGTLKERMQTRLSLPEIDRLFSQLLAALNYAHTQNVVHRDIKPANALVDSQDNLFLTDFGIAKILEKQTQFTEAGALIGTPDYMSPEQAQGMQLDRRSDIYSLGIILYEMVTGHVPFEAETPLAVILKHIHDPLPPPSILRPGLSPAIEAVILKALAKKPEDRFATCQDFLDAWQAAVKASGGNLTTTGSPAPQTLPAISTPTGAGTSRLPTSPVVPHSGSGNRDLMIVLGLGGLLLVIVCLVVVAGLGGLTLLSNRLGQASSSTPILRTPQPGTPIIENTPGLSPTLPPSTEIAAPTEAGVATPGPAATQPSLLVAHNISNTQFESEDPQVALDDQGHVLAIWSDKTDRTEGDVLFAQTNDDGDWTKPERISSGDGTLVASSIRWLTKPDGTPCAIWYNNTQWILRCRSGQAWAEPETQNIDASWADGPAFAFAPDGSLAVAKYSFADAFFNGDVVSNGRNNVQDLRMVLDDDGNPHLVWMEQDNGTFALVGRFSPDGGKSWNDIETLSTTETAPGLGSPFDLAADLSGTVHLAWTAQGGQIYYQAWTADGGWSKPLGLTGGKALVDLDLTVDANDYAHIAASGLVGTRQGIIYFGETSEGWQPAQLLEEDLSGGLLSRNVRLVIDNDDVRHFVWQSSAAKPDIFYAQLP